MEYLGIFVFFVLFLWFLMFAFAITVYILQSLGMMTMAKSLGIENPWMAFLPYASTWLLGKIAEFDVKPGAKPKKWGIILLTMQILLGIAALILYFGFIVTIVSESYNAASNPALMDSDAYFMQEILPSLLGILGGVLLLMIFAIVVSVLQYICMYKIFRIFLPQSATGLTVLTIFLPVAFSFIVFANRKKIPRNPYTGEPLGIYAGYSGYYPNSGFSYYG